jgi:hypothetical protein
MAFIPAFINLFGQVNISQNAETFDRYHLDGDIRNFHVPVLNDFISAIQQSGLTDYFKLAIIIHDEVFSYSLNENDTNFIKDLTQKAEYLGDGDFIGIDLSIEKETREEKLIVYDWKLFLAWLNSLTPSRLMPILGNVLQNGRLLLLCYGLDESFYTSNILFQPYVEGSADPFKSISNRSNLQTKIRSVAFEGSSNPLLVIPDDFHWIKPPKDVVFKNLFNRCCLILCIKSLADYSVLSENTLHFKINGLKTINATLDISLLSLASKSEYYQIYFWVYENGGTNDKLGIARNLLSLNISSDQHTLPPATVESVLSGYKVYEKQNVKQYIELRNKMADQMASFSDRANKIIEVFASGFQKSAVAFVSLFATIVIIRVLTTHEFTHIFTRDALVVSFAFLASSFGYFFVARWEVTIQKKRFENAYRLMKERNRDLLTEGDIQSILNHDEEFISDKLFIESKQRNYTLLWLGYLALFMILSLILYYY